MEEATSEVNRAAFWAMCPTHYAVIGNIITKINTEQHAVTNLNTFKSPTPLAFYHKGDYSVHTLLHCHG